MATYVLKSFVDSPYMCSAEFSAGNHKQARAKIRAMMRTVFPEAKFDFWTGTDRVAVRTKDHGTLRLFWQRRAP
jgi:hypothetical protein